jgi:hypothetical protein
MIWQLGGNVLLVVQALLAAAIVGVGLVVAWGLLSGRTWAWWVDLVLMVLLGLACLAGVAMLIVSAVMLESQGFAQEFQRQQENASAEEKIVAGNFLHAILAAYAMPLVVGFLLGVTSLVALLARRTGEWFRFARQLRWEHKQLREALR